MMISVAGRKYFVFLTLLTWLCWSCVNVASAKSASSDELFLKCELNESTVYAGQPVTATVYLYSKHPSIAFINRVNDPSLEKGDFQFIRRVNENGRGGKVNIEGETYFRFPVESYIFSVAEKGKAQFRSPDYKVGINQRVVVNDPFWGPMQTMQAHSVEVPHVDKLIKISSLPSPQNGTAFSGSIGDFSIVTTVPRGDIFVGEEATAFVTVSGPGVIAESVIPDYKSAFSNGMKLKSVSDNREEKLVNGKFHSELTLEFTFIPESSDNLEIGPVSFDFFHPDKKKYCLIKSDPVTVKVKSSTVRRNHLDI